MAAACDKMCAWENENRNQLRFATWQCGDAATRQLAAVEANNSIRDNCAKFFLA